MEVTVTGRRTHQNVIVDLCAVVALLVTCTEEQPQGGRLACAVDELEPQVALRDARAVNGASRRRGHARHREAGKRHDRLRRGPRLLRCDERKIERRVWKARLPT